MKDISTATNFITTKCGIVEFTKQKLSTTKFYEWPISTYLILDGYTYTIKSCTILLQEPVFISVYKFN